MREKLKNKKIFIIIIAILIIVVFLGIFKNKILKIIYPKTYKEIVSVYSEKYNVEENLVFALISEAVSHRDAIGVMQIMEETAKDVANKNSIKIENENIKQELLKIDNNINIGTKYLSTLLEKYKNKEIAVAAYNAGIGTIDGWIQKGIIKSDGSDIENIPYKETNNYVRKILRNYKLYE